ncbi:MAG: hypothetical protein ACR2RD_15385, partial [Woeseiaceae bacterium]
QGTDRNHECQQNSDGYRNTNEAVEFHSAFVICQARLEMRQAPSIDFRFAYRQRPGARRYELHRSQRS